MTCAKSVTKLSRRNFFRRIFLHYNADRVGLLPRYPETKPILASRRMDSLFLRESGQGGIRKDALKANNQLLRDLEKQPFAIL